MRRLRELEALEAPEPDAVEAELAAVFAPHEEAVSAAVESVARVQTLSDAQRALAEAFRERNLPRGEEAERALCASVVALLESSDEVEELYADDETLTRVVSAAVMDFVRDVDERAFTRLREAARGDVPVVGVEESAPTLSFAELGYPFPLFDAPIQNANLTEGGACCLCRGEADVRFSGACYACFRSGRVRHTVGTETGMVTTQTADTDALRELARTPTYHSRQGEAWLFCCDVPMVFTGTLSAAPGDRCDRLDAFCTELNLDREQVLRALLPEEEVPDSAKMLDDLMCARLDIQTFRCSSCRQRRAYWER